MNDQSRRDFVRSIAAATVSAGPVSQFPHRDRPVSIHRISDEPIADLTQVPDRTWIGPDFWANRLEDWRVRDSRIECLADDPLHSVRTVHFITREVQPGSGSFRLSARTGIIARNDGKGWTGFLIGAGAGKLDYRAAALVHCSSGPGGGLLAILNTDSGRLEFRNMGTDSAGGEFPVLADSAGDPIPLDERGINLILEITPNGSERFDLTLTAASVVNDEVFGRVVLQFREDGDIIGSTAIVSHAAGEDGARGTTFWFSQIRTGGDKIVSVPQRAFGPLAACLYTTATGILKMTAQFLPLGLDVLNDDPRQLLTHQATLEYRHSGGMNSPWTSAQTTRIRALDRGAHFRIEEWDDSRDWEYRILLRGWDQPVGNGIIRKDPVEKPVISSAALSCAGVMGLTAYARDTRSGLDPYAGRWSPSNVWFPNANLVGNIRAQNPDILFFTGDQIYEIKPTPRPYTNRFPMLDYLYKWYLWCWSFGELTRDIPCTCQLDDHDVYQGNLWGSSGQLNMTGRNNGGGYELDPVCVNAIASTQCSHMPDPYDRVPAGEGVRNYYTGFTYGGIGIAILEDRKFKVPPAAMDSPNQSDLPLLGETQEKFLEEWGDDWTDQVMKVVVSQTIYASAHTDRGGQGTLAVDADTNGFPKQGRDRAVDLFRRANALVISGDQHLATVMQLGTENPGDGPYQFCVPAVGNIFWRYFYPTEPGLNRDPGAPEYTGDFVDGFGNHFRMIAVANPKDLDVYQAGIPNWMDAPSAPRQHRREDRYSQGDGYGIVRFDKTSKTATIECWPHNAMPSAVKEGRGQFAGWPVEVSF
jgi:alkaline phosphatase D